MKHKWLALVATLFVSQPLLAGPGGLEGIHGTWWNPGFAGEGFSFEQYDDGFVIGYWYTYDMDGNQLWLIGTGTVENNLVDLQMMRTRGGRLGSDDNPGLVSEEHWGVVTLHLIDCATIEMTYQGEDGNAGGYSLERIVKDPLAATTCGEAADDGLQVAVKLQRSDAFGNWVDVNLPWAGTHTIEKDYNGSGSSVTLYRLQLTSLEGQLAISGLVAQDSTGLTSPSIEGIYTGMTLPEGVPVIFELKAHRTAGETALPSYRIGLQNTGDIINLTVQLRTN